ncbi:Actin-binding protein F [Choanephora cucurbitarum]|uniref:Actin-binding protein F n=1 Tax=Choanephora cucurbitarum TaxID=101091 RepID=A0A1C7NLS1_9FUNG|nr:Actin-binding protein F [Choanephora cucurbitarum]
MPSVSSLKRAFAMASTVEERELALKKHATSNTDDELYFQGLIILQKLHIEMMKQVGPSKLRDPSQTEKGLIAQMEKHLTLLSSSSFNPKRFDELNARFHLLVYPLEADKTIKFLKKELKIQSLNTFPEGVPNHSSTSVTPNQVSTAPSMLDPQLINGKMLLRKNLISSLHNQDSIQPTAFFEFSSIWDELSDKTKTRLLSEITRLPFEHVFDDKIIAFLTDCFKDAPLIAEVLSEKISFKTFTIEKMNRLMQTLPRITFLVNSFTNEYLLKLAPEDCPNLCNNSIWDDDQNVLKNYLDRLKAFANGLPDFYRPLKLMIAFHQLRVDIVRRDFSEDRFLRFISLNTNMPSDFSVSSQFSGLSTKQSSQAQPKTVEPSKLRVPILGPCDISAKNRDAVVKEYLIGLIEQNKLTKTVEDLGAHLDYTNFIKPLYAYVMITSSRTVNNEWVQMLGASSYEQLIEKKMVTFAPQTLHRLVKRKPLDPIVLSVRTKNIDRLSVRVYEIESENYARLSLRNPKAKDQIELEGILPTFEESIDFSNEPSLTIKTTTFTFGGQEGIASDVFKGRGIWVIEFVGGENQCRTIVQKGYLRHVIQETVAGHVLRIIDEENTVVKRAKVWYNNRYYESDESSNITIPYLPSDKEEQSSRIVLISSDDGFSESVAFTHAKENLMLETNFYVNSEMVYPNKKASVVVLPRLTLNGNSVPLSLLEDPSLTIDIGSSDSAKHSITCQNVGKDLKAIYYEFMVPDQLHILNLHFKARARKMDNTFESFHSEHIINYHSASDASGLPPSVHLTKSKEGRYLLHAFGKNGEIKNDCEISLRFKHTFLKEMICVPMKTNAEGYIDLGELKDICYFEHFSAHATYKQWKIQSTEDAVLPENLIVPAHTEFKIAYASNQTRPDCALYRLGYNSVLVDNMSKHIKKDISCLEIKGLPAGNYMLYLHRADGEIKKISCKIVDDQVKMEGRLWTGWIVNKKYFGKYDTDIVRKPLIISEIKLDDEKIDVHVKNNSAKTYIVATVSTFLPTSQDSLKYKLLSDRRLNIPTLQTAEFLNTQSVFLSDRRISDEYQYILNRSKSEKWAGSNLTKPSLLLYPKKTRDTLTNAKYLCTGHTLVSTAVDNTKQPSFNFNTKLSRKKPDTAQRFAAFAKMAYTNDYTNSIDASLAFLSSNLSTVVIAIDRDSNIATFDRNQLGVGGRLLQIVAISGDQLVAKQVDLTHDHTFHTKDLRQPVSANKRLIMAKAIKELMPAEALTLNTHDFAIIDSFEKLFDTIKVISSAGRMLIDEFEFLRSWPTFSLEKKLKTHEEKVCHELNLWLKKKDPQFFNAYVKPVIKNKVRKSFMDSYLLDEDLTPYCRDLYHFEKLNVVEKALLASTQPNQTLQATLRSFKDNLDDKQHNYQFDSIFESVLAGNNHSNTSTDDVGFNDNPPIPEASVFQVAAMEAPTSRSLFGSSAPIAIGSSSSAGFGSSSSSGLFGSKWAGSASSPVADAKEEEDISYTMSSENTSEEANFDGDGADDEALLELRKRSLQTSKKVYSFVEKTSEWKDAEYYDDNATFQLKQFWVDYLEYVHNNAPCFLPESFIYTLDSIQEIFYVLSLVDLPFASQVDWKVGSTDLGRDNSSSDFGVNICTYCHPVIVFYRTLVPCEQKEDSNHKDLILAQEFFVSDNSTTFYSEERVKIDPSTQNFSPQIEYGQHLTITNISSKPLDCQVTFQIPTGAVPVQMSSYCKSQAIRIEAYSTWHQVASIFYFPTHGEYASVPITVASASGDVFLGALESVIMHVIGDTESMLDHKDTTNPISMSWPSLATRGSDESVLTYLESYRKLNKLDLELVGWRMSDRKFAGQVFDILASRQYYCRSLAVYGVQHHFDDVIRDLIQFSGTDIMNNLGAVFESPLITKNEFGGSNLFILDYYPLLNARAHPFQSNAHEILNQEFYEQYDTFLEYLSLKNTPLTVPDLVMLTIYLLLQDHIGEAQVVLSQISSSSDQNIDCQVQIDYLNAYLKTRIPIVNGQHQMQLLDLQFIKDISQKYKNFGSLKWRKMFSGLLNFVREVEQGELMFSAEDSSNMSIQPESLLEFSIDHLQKKLVVQYANIDTIDVKFYEMNIEAMFSSNPFMGVNSHSSKLETSFTWTKPNRSVTVELPKQSEATASMDQDSFDIIGAGQTGFLQTTEVPFENINKNLFIEIAGGNIKRYQVHFANKMHVHVSESFGVVRVMSQETKRPLAGAYVKVYIRLKQWGGVQFWKDGYTGLNGVFDYISVTSGNVLIGNQQLDLKTIMHDKVDKLSILVLSEEEGAIVKEVYPPYGI